MDRAESPRVSSYFSIRLIFGVAVVLAGVLLALDEMRILDADDYLLYWPVALIAIGVAKLFGRGTIDLLVGAVLAGFGAWALANNLGWIQEVPWGYVWPIVLVLVGAHLLSGGFRRRLAPADSEDFISAFAVLGGGQRRSTSQHFAGADLTAVMGGWEIDLRRARIEPGTTPVIEVFALWGGITLRFPQDWKIDLGVLPVLGGYGDETEQTVRPDSPTVRIQGSAVMGGIEIKN